MILFRVYNRLIERNISAQDTRFVLITSSTNKIFSFEDEFSYYKSGSCVHFRGATIDFNPIKDYNGVEETQISNFFSKEFYLHKFYFVSGELSFFVVSHSSLTENEILLLQDALLETSNNKFDIFKECNRCRVFHNGEVDFNVFDNIKEENFSYKSKKIKNFNKEIKEIYNHINYYEEHLKDLIERRDLIYDTLTDEEKLIIEVSNGS